MVVSQRIPFAVTQGPVLAADTTPPLPEEEGMPLGVKIGLVAVLLLTVGAAALAAR